MKALSLVNWAHLQHYKDRNPPWLKLYRDLLTSESWVLGTDQSRLVQVASIMLAARYNNEIPLRFDLLKRVASFDMSEKQFMTAVDHLATVGYCEIKEIDSPLATCKQLASNGLATCNTEERERESRGEESRAEGEGHRASKKCPAEFEPDLTFAAKLLPDIDAGAEAAQFKDHEFPRPLKDWGAAWRNWVRKAKKWNSYAKKDAIKWT